MNIQRITKKFPRNHKCPCGSGNKYKNCCIDKDFAFDLTDTGDVTKKVPMSDETIKAFKLQAEKFKEKFGREIGPNDPVFFDPNKDIPTPIDEDILEKETIKAMEKANIPAHFIYAFKKTGLMLFEGSENKYTKKDIKNYEDAVEEYFNLNK